MAAKKQPAAGKKTATRGKPAARKTAAKVGKSKRSSSMNDETKGDSGSDQEQLAAALSSTSDNSLDTVRDILFGAQVRQTTQRTDQLEQRMTDLVTALRKDMDGHVKAIEKTIAKLETRLANEAEKTAADVDRRFQEANAAIASLDAASRTARSELFDQLTAEREDLEKRASAWNEDLAKQLEQVHASLRHDKTDRATLVRLLSDMAASIADDGQDAAAG